MNKVRRKELQKALDLLAEAKIIIDQCREEEQGAFDNMPEGFQASERGEQMEEYIGIMEEAYDHIEDAETNLEDII